MIQISDRMGKSISGLNDFIKSADRGLVDYAHIKFPQSELGDIGYAIMQNTSSLRKATDNWLRNAND